MLRYRWLAAVAVLSMAACSPTHNWREWRADGAPLWALLPCKPDLAERPVPLTASPVVLHLASCEAGGQTFALGWARLGDPGLAPQALQRWRLAGLKSLRAESVDEAATRWTVAVAGAAPVLGVRAEGRDHRNQPVLNQTVYFVQGDWIFQAAVYGAQLPDAVTEPFFTGLRLSGS